MRNYCSDTEALEREKDNLQALYLASAELRVIFDQCQHSVALQALGRAVVDARHAEAYLEQHITFYEGHEAVAAIRKEVAILLEQDEERDVLAFAHPTSAAREAGRGGGE